MRLTTAIIKASFSSRLAYAMLNKIMTKLATKKQEDEKEPVVDTEKILEENRLKFIETGFFRDKKTVTRVCDQAGKVMILKTGRIDPCQAKLLRAAKAIENDLCFKVPVLVKEEEGWILLEEVQGRFLDAYFDEKPDWCVEVSKRIADDYQKVILEIQKTETLGDLLAEGEEWLYSRLNMWSKPIVDAGFIDFPLVQKIQQEFKEIVSRKGEEFFGWVHGNVIGDHIVVSGSEFYLLDLNVTPRVGRGYYDFLRALDFMFLKTRDSKRMFDSLSRWMKEYLADFDEQEVRLVLASRAIGILGWDILHEKVEYTQGDLEEKKGLIVKIIKGQY